MGFLLGGDEIVGKSREIRKTIDNFLGSDTILYWYILKKKYHFETNIRVRVKWDCSCAIAEPSTWKCVCWALFCHSKSRHIPGPRGCSKMWLLGSSGNCAYAMWAIIGDTSVTVEGGDRRILEKPSVYLIDN
jgi:hypothetical protein